MSYAAEWSVIPVALGALLVLLIVPSFAVIALVVIAIAVLAALLALAGAILVSPYLLARTLRRRLDARHQATKGSVRIVPPTAQADPSG